MNSGESHIVQLIFNRTSGGHCPRTLAALREVLESRGVRVIACESGPGMKIDIADEATHVCAVGGDGTIRHVAHALQKCGRRLPLSIYPAGTVNLIHREIGSPLDPAAHVARMLAGAEACDHYAAEVGDHLFLACASVGPDSRAVAALSPGLKRRIGKAAYLVAFLGLLRKWPRDAITLRHAGGEHRCEAFYVAKGRFFAGPWSFAPEAELRQPLLHVLALQRARRRDFARFALALLANRRADRLPGVVAFSCTELTAEASAPLPVQADGDVVTTLPASIRVRPDPMRFC